MRSPLLKNNNSKDIVPVGRRPACCSHQTCFPPSPRAYPPASFHHCLSNVQTHPPAFAHMTNLAYSLHPPLPLFFSHSVQKQTKKPNRFEATNTCGSCKHPSHSVSIPCIHARTHTHTHAPIRIDRHSRASAVLALLLFICPCCLSCTFAAFRSPHPLLVLPLIGSIFVPVFGLCHTAKHPSGKRASWRVFSR